MVTVRVAAVNRRGRSIALDVRCGALRSPAGAVQGCILIMDREALTSHDGEAASVHAAQ